MIRRTKRHTLIGIISIYLRFLDDFIYFLSTCQICDRLNRVGMMHMNRFILIITLVFIKTVCLYRLFSYISMVLTCFYICNII